VGLGLWSWNDPLRREHHGLTVGGSTMLAWRPVEQFSVIAGLDVYDNRVSGTGLSATVRMLVRI